MSEPGAAQDVRASGAQPRPAGGVRERDGGRHQVATRRAQRGRGRTEGRVGERWRAADATAQRTEFDGSEAA